MGLIMITFSWHHKTGLGTVTYHVVKHQNKMFQSDDSAIKIRSSFIILLLWLFNRTICMNLLKEYMGSRGSGEVRIGFILFENICSACITWTVIQPSDIPFVLKRYPIFGCSLKFIFFETHETNLLFMENNQNPIYQLTDEKHIMNDYF